MEVHCAYDKIVPIEQLKSHPKNRNKHSSQQIDRFIEILKAQGIRRPIRVSKLTNRITSGHGLLEALKKMGEKTAPIDLQEYENEDFEYQDLIADNALQNWSELDLASINLDIQDLGPDFDIDLLGIKDFVVEPADKYGGKDADRIPDVKNTSIQLGDLFQLGNHRLLCGDSTDSRCIERLMNGEKADMVYTDPPYGMNLDTDYSTMGKSSHSWKPVIGDDAEYDPSFIFKTFKDCKEIFLWGADYYCWNLPRNGSWVVWDKRTKSTGENFGNIDDTFGSSFELCWSKHKHKRNIARILWTAGCGEGKSEERVGRNNAPKRFHPTQKPVMLHEYFFSEWGKDKINIVDLYLGSGSTLIACERTNRKCFGMEIDPQYCQVIVDRWEKFTGQKAEKIN